MTHRIRLLMPLLLLGLAAMPPARADGLDLPDHSGKSDAAVAGVFDTAPDAVSGDGRIRILHYSSNDIYTLFTRVGYQSYVEFSPNEQIDTISVGDRSFWQIVPSGNRVFIRPMEEDVATNMTVITNKHSYQFDLKSATGPKDKRIIYVLRFSYPEIAARRAAPAEIVSAVAAPVPLVEAAPAMPVTPEPPVSAPSPAPLMSAPPAYASAAPESSAVLPSPSRRNYLYTYSGPDAAAPYEVFDDGKTTYLRYQNAFRAAPLVTMLAPDGREIAVETFRRDGYIAVNTVVPVLILNNGEGRVFLYNEALSPSASTATSSMGAP